MSLKEWKKQTEKRIEKAYEISGARINCLMDNITKEGEVINKGVGKNELNLKLGQSVFLHPKQKILAQFGECYFAMHAERIVVNIEKIQDDDGALGIMYTLGDPLEPYNESKHFRVSRPKDGLVCELKEYDLNRKDFFNTVYKIKFGR